MGGASGDSGASGIRRLALHTPFPVGDVNVYLVEDEPLTLIDTGPNTASALVQIQAELADLGYLLSDIGRILITHHHVDHAGLAGPLAALSGAEVLAPDGLDRWLADGYRSQLGEDRDAGAELERAGLDHDSARLFSAARHGIAGFVADCDSVIQVEAGATVEFAARSLKTHLLPGHSPLDMVFEDENSGVLFGGDVLLAGWDSTCLPARVGPWHESLFLVYRESLRKLAGLDPQTILPGHGEAVESAPDLIGRRLKGHELEAERLLKLLRGQGRARLFDLCRGFDAVAAVKQPYFALRKVQGLVDLLRDGELVSVQDERGVRWCEAR